MILFLDVNKQTISLYDNNGKTDVPFKNAGELVKHTKNINNHQGLFIFFWLFTV